jgi:1-hydroxycarotenoid 3,4-desaturase
MFQVASALAKLGEKYGVKSRYGVTCAEIMTSQGRVSGVQLSTGEMIEADHVIFNGDVSALAVGMLGSSVSSSFEPVRPSHRSLSAFTLSMHAKTSGFPLVRHNVFFNQDYRAEFDDIFRKRQLPSQGTVYVCAQDRDDSGLAQGESERIFCLVNAPPDGDHHAFNSSEIQACETSSMALMRRCGLEIEVLPQQVVRTLPQDFARLFPGSGGALYGQATHGWMSAFRRSSARSKVPGLYTAGGSVHPGPGVPMAAMSGRLAAATLLAHLDSTSRSRRVLISGGTSMPSATMAGTG